MKQHHQETVDLKDELNPKFIIHSPLSNAVIMTFGLDDASRHNTLYKYEI